MSKLWDDKAAVEWEEAFPIGNGRIGAMIFGTPGSEHLQLNEESIWYGGPVNRLNPDMKENLPKIRELIFNGRIAEAEKRLDSGQRMGMPSQYGYVRLPPTRPSIANSVWEKSSGR